MQVEVSVSWGSYTSHVEIRGTESAEVGRRSHRTERCLRRYQWILIVSSLWYVHGSSVNIKALITRRQDIVLVQSPPSPLASDRCSAEDLVF